ncbi:MAG TPA: DUF2950 domain-containing protein [Xanthobacteraceae bacterium]|jgi:hypothetical protein
MLRSLSFAGLLVTVFATAAGAQQSFKGADEAATALATAAKTGDRAAILAVLGRDADDIVTSGDEVADKAIREQFIQAYDQKHQIDKQGDGLALLVIGNDDFPFPIPIVRRNDAWQFDTSAGRQEILYRRVGANELDAIQVCLAYVDAQDEYADKDRGAGAGVYAQRVISQPGQKDGLYWPTSVGEDQSPMGDLAAAATAQGYRVGSGHAPFHGYYYKILTRQGPNAPGGALDYVVKGKMIGGFALVAFPAEYGNSGVMTFMVSHDGTIFQKDLGPQTGERAEQIATFDPDSSWTRVEGDALRVNR